MRLRVSEISDFLLRCAHIAGRANYYEKPEDKKTPKRYEDLRQTRETAGRVSTRTSGADLGFILTLAGG